MDRFTDKQKAILRFLLSDDPKHRVLFLVGSAGTGKSIGGAAGFLAHASKYVDTHFILGGKVETSVVRNLEPPLKDAAGMFGIDYKKIRDGYRIGSNDFYRFGANDEKSQDKVQGMSAAGALLDEAVLFPRSFVNQTFARLRVPGAKAVLTMNPQGPNHWMKKEFIDRADEMNGHVINFTLDDNPHLDPAAREFYEGAFTGVFYDRMVLGLWAAATGLVWPAFTELSESPSGIPSELEVSVDWGAASVTAAIAFGRFGNDWIAVAEYYWDADKNGHRAADEHARAIMVMCDPFGVRVKNVIVDPSAVELNKALGKLATRPTRVVKGDNKVVDGIQNTGVALENGLVKIAPSCRQLIGEMATYRWDEKAAARGEDRPVKRDDHACDALRYFARRRFGKIGVRKPTKKPARL